MSLSTAQTTQIRSALVDMMGDVVAVETYGGASGQGSKYGTSANVTCNVNAKRKLVRNAAGAEVISETTLQVKPADEAKFTPQSRVTIVTKTSLVITVSPKTYKGVVVYAEVALT
jgi:hypothetical protein